MILFSILPNSGMLKSTLLWQFLVFLLFGIIGTHKVNEKIVLVNQRYVAYDTLYANYSEENLRNSQFIYLLCFRRICQLGLQCFCHFEGTFHTVFTCELSYHSYSFTSQYDANLGVWAQWCFQVNKHADERICRNAWRWNL